MAKTPIQGVHFARTGLAKSAKCAVTGGSPASPVQLQFDTGSDFGHFSANCFSLTFEYSRDTDGSAFVFVPQAPDVSTCAPTDKALAGQLLALLPTVVEWRATTSEEIAFVDQQGREVVRATSSGSSFPPSSKGNEFRPWQA